MLSLDARSIMWSRVDLERSGLSGRSILARVRDGEWHRVDRGWYVSQGDWRSATTETRHLVRVIAAHARRASPSSLVFSHCSAAVLWGLPLARLEPRRVHISGSRANGHVSGGDPLVSRHEVAVPARDIVDIGGMLCTSLARTVADFIRCATEEAGIALADAALRQVAWDASTRSYDLRAAGAFVAEVHERLPLGGRGVKRARWVLGLADGRAELPGESISRLQLLRLGFAAPRLQVPVAGPRGHWYFIDFGLDDAGAWGEFDGQGKYSDPAMLNGKDIATVVRQEKEREDWVRGTTNRKFARWESRHIATPAALQTRLAAFHIHP